MGDLPFEEGAPSAVICHTTKGKGFGVAEGNPEWHHRARLTEVEIAELYRCLE